MVPHSPSAYLLSFRSRILPLGASLIFAYFVEFLTEAFQIRKIGFMSVSGSQFYLGPDPKAVGSTLSGFQMIHELR